MVIGDRTKWRQTFRARYRVGDHEKTRTLVFEWEGQRAAFSPQAAIAKVMDIEDVQQLVMVALDIEIAGVREIEMDWREGVRHADM